MSEPTPSTTTNNFPATTGEVAPPAPLAVTKTEIPKNVKGLLQGDYCKSQIALVLPKHLKADRIVRLAMSALIKTPDLADCTPQSFLNCLVNMSALGLEPDGRRAHLIPYNDRNRNVKECTLVIDWKGLADIIRRSGELKDMHVDVVREGDAFVYQEGDGAILSHVPVFPRNGAVTHAYSFVRLANGGRETEVMGVDDLDAIRQRSKSKDKGPWVTDTEEMYKKTVFRRHSKRLPFSPEVRDVIEADDDLDVEEKKFKAAKPVFDSSFLTPEGAE